MDLGFCGEVAEFYHRYRRGYPAAVIDSLADAFALTGDDIVVDLGCGTGQLALPIARRVRAVAGSTRSRTCWSAPGAPLPSGTSAT